MGWSKKDKITESKNSKQGLINQIKFIRHFIIFLVHFISYVGFMHHASVGGGVVQREKNRLQGGCVV